MSRDGRGNPGRIVLKNQPRLRLADVLRRRRSTLHVLISELGISTYGALELWCGRMGVVAPTQHEFEQVIPAGRFVNSPQEGVLVLEAPPGPVDELVDDVDERSAPGSIMNGPEETVKRRRQKKESPV